MSLTSGESASAARELEGCRRATEKRSRPICAMRLNEIGSCAEKSQVESVAAAAAAAPQLVSCRAERTGRVEARRLRCLDRRKEDVDDRTDEALDEVRE